MLDLARMFAPQAGYIGANNNLPLETMPQIDNPQRRIGRMFGGQTPGIQFGQMFDRFNQGKSFNDPAPVPTSPAYDQGGHNYGTQHSGAPHFVGQGPDPMNNPFNPSPFGANLNSMLGRQPAF